MRYLIILIAAFLLFACGPDNSFETIGVFQIQYDHNNANQRHFVEHLQSYYTTLLRKLGDCAAFAVPSAPRTHVQSLRAGGLYLKPDLIVLNERAVRLMSIWGHEWVRHLLYWNGSPHWADLSEGPGNGWEHEPTRCLWNLAETWSLCYLPNLQPGTYEWCNK